MSRLLFLTERFYPDIGGVARSATRIAQSLCQLEVEVDILTWSRFVQPGEVLNEQVFKNLSHGDLDLRVYRIGLYVSQENCARKRGKTFCCNV